ncbi:MAG: hypothetical protein A2958_02750 [Candidatus Levybacteria bacterium RIFCSPLOWO2_01_FULL_38_13]|nr:MAG: hypothetical protein A2629_03165 [Candidatus Levybacteria bacterium RIFCSPHIGHO2_01_FULL_41_15]OGH35256.1 MAG: hypothetical protein A2958_02750 [Candidatus Levybacteria bacterium RIFCSPLOWO2_01_FULL_38_13]
MPLFYIKIIKSLSSRNLGFTLIELLIVIGASAVISVVGVSAFVTYSQSQALNSASSDIISLFNLARSRAYSQIKPSSCSGSLAGYRISLDTTNAQYSLEAVCSSSATFVVLNKKLPSNIIFLDSPATNPTTYSFPVLTGGVHSGGTIRLKGYGKEKTLTVDSQGNVK